MSNAPRQKKEESPSTVTVFRFVAGYWKRQPKKLALILFLFVTATFLEAKLPDALSSFLESIRVYDHDPAPILWYLGLFLGTYFSYVILRNVASFVYNSFETRIFTELVNDIFVHVQYLSERFFVNTFAGSIITKVKRGRDRIETFEDQLILRLLPTAVILTSSAVLLYFRFPTLAIALAAYLVIVIVVSVVMVLRFAGPAQGLYASTEDVFGAHLADSIASIATTKAYAQERKEIGRFFSVTELLRARNLSAYYRGNATGFLQQAMLGGMLALLLGGGTWYFLHGQASIEDMAYLAFAYNIMQSYVREVGENIKNLLTSSYDLHAVVELMQEVPHVRDAPNAPALNVAGGAIAWNDVSFTYPGKKTPIFEHFSLSIRAGERVALVGHSGSGKTTFVRLLQRLYDVQGGDIHIDGQNLKEIAQSSLRNAIALVPQDPVLFHRSLKDNIAYATPNATLDDVRSAATKAHIDEFIMQLPEQYETLVGERGIKLSGGERQRVAIARAILSDRPILILDEATSSLDSASERAIQDALQALTHGRTSIMVAHRLSTIQDADRILVFDGGRIIEEGTHAELVKRENGAYAQFFKLQSGGYV
ncbi:MAG: ABC transporter ATP-binding protein [bacterium]